VKKGLRAVLEQRCRGASVQGVLEGPGGFSNFSSAPLARNVNAPPGSSACDLRVKQPSWRGNIPPLHRLEDSTGAAQERDSISLNLAWFRSQARCSTSKSQLAC